MLKYNNAIVISVMMLVILVSVMPSLLFKNLLKTYFPIKFTLDSKSVVCAKILQLYCVCDDKSIFLADNISLMS
jgi:hypothetical protein